MYGIRRQSWVALGDPVGEEKEIPELLRRFREICADHGGRPVFSEIGRANLYLYLDLGLTLLKIGEEGRVSLETFSLEGGGERKELRHENRKLEKLGCVFEVIPREEVGRFLPELKRISDAWLVRKHTREKKFSMGFYKEDYLRRFPIALVKQGEKILAFANLLLGGEKEELTFDLIRYLPSAPSGIMDHLFTQAMLWGKQAGYRWFSLGMAPLAGLENRAFAPIWNRIGALIFRHGEHFYNFKGIREYKNKFGPIWEPKYLASPGGLSIPRVLTDIASLNSGGIRGIFWR